MLCAFSQFLSSCTASWVSGMTIASYSIKNLFVYDVIVSNIIYLTPLTAILFIPNPLIPASTICTILGGAIISTCITMVIDVIKK